MKFKIGIWGQYSNGRTIADGQAVRTTVIANELIERYGKENIYIIDTENWKQQPFSFLFNTIKLYLKCEKVIIAPADNGYKVVVPIYAFLGLFVKRELYDIVIGGYLPELLKRKPFYSKCMRKYRALFVQTPKLRSALNDIGLDNVYILSNLKRLNTRRIEEVEINNEEELLVCTLSRVNESKGIEDAISAVKLTNECLGRNVFTLDIFGIVSEEYKEQFDKLLDECSGFVNYGGVLKYNKTVETLKNYFALIFPTFYYGEGFPGNVIDSFHSGLPIIATDWNYNSEVIKEGRNGILVPIHNPMEISKALISLYNDRELQYKISCNNIEDAYCYIPEVVLSKLYEFLDN